MTRLTFLAGAALAAFAGLPALAWAADPAPDGDNPNTGATAVDTLVVVANRNPEPLYKIGQSVTVLDAQAIRQSQAVSVDGLLDQTPGVAVVRNGGQGQTATVGIRGAQSEQTLVLIDGVQINDPSSPAAGFDFSNLMVGDISRVEVLRGSQSVLWGSQAIGGVVNIVTTPPPAGTIGAELNAEGGSRHTQYWRGAVGGTFDRLSLRLAGGYYSTAGISVFDGGQEPDGFHAGTFSGRLLFDLSDALQLDQRVFYNQSKAAFDGFSTPTFSFGDDTEYGTESEVVSYSGVNLTAFGGKLKNRFAFEYARTNRRSFDPLSFSAPITETFYGDGASKRFEYQGTAQIAPGYTAVFGAQHERTSIVTGAPAFFSP
ncbi:MAG: TonB-dependent receptor, partial [Proteobacteria bacterium]|nr:TonB-dependent receptor [Pseudomonadota bacterium]